MTPTLYVTIPNGKRVPLGRLVSEWKRLKTLPPESEISGWQSYPVAVADVLRDLSAAVLDRINIRAGAKPLAEADSGRIYRRRARRVRVECRWCGRAMPWQPAHNRFCCPDCKQSFYS